MSKSSDSSDSGTLTRVSSDLSGLANILSNLHAEGSPSPISPQSTSTSRSTGSGNTRAALISPEGSMSYVQSRRVTLTDPLIRFSQELGAVTPETLSSSSPPGDRVKFSFDVAEGRIRDRLLRQLPVFPERIMSPAEQESYYHGLPSRPVYLAGSRNPRRVTLFPHPHRVHLYPVSATASICVRWQEEILPIVLRILDDHCPEAVCLDLVKIGLSETEADTIVWIGVNPSFAPTAAEHLVAKVERELLQCEIDEVFRVEIRITTITESVGPFADMDVFDPRAAPYATPLRASMGIGLSPQSHPNRLGTGGIFLQNGSSPQVYLLTCHHVVSPDAEARLPEDTARSSIERVSLSVNDPVAKVLEALARRLKNDSETLRPMKFMQKSLARKGPPTETDGNEAEVEDYHRQVKEVEAFITSYSGTTAALNAGRAAIEALQDGQLDQTIGHVHCYPPIRISAVDFCEDWALVVLNDASIPSEGVINGIIFPMIPGAHDIPFALESRLSKDTDGVLRATSCIPEMENGSHDVVKNGVKSGLTAGRSNPAKSVLRHVVDPTASGGIKSVWSKEVPVLGTPEQMPFSKEGDSGAVVLDANGRMLGMLTSGAGSPGGLKDVTYLTPMWWLLERLRAFGFDPQLVT